MKTDKNNSTGYFIAAAFAWAAIVLVILGLLDIISLHVEPRPGAPYTQPATSEQLFTALAILLPFAIGFTVFGFRIQKSKTQK